MGTRTADCRKFSPNIFNKSKCSHCFRQREEHSAAALESNRATRKISKCGYLFVAPDWDFNNPLYRTKRWQRRWFVLYDDGELTYSVDEHPETIPQASVDMTRVLEVSTAEDVTGHNNSVAITAPDRVTFVKGTCPEESKWWLNILSAFPKSKGRHKRNATFPGGQTTTQSTTNSNIINSVVNGVGNVVGRNRHNSYHKDTTITITNINNNNNNNNTNNNNNNNNLDSWENNNSDSTPGTPVGGQDENNKNVGNELTNRVYTDQPISSKSLQTRDKIYPETKAHTRIRNNRNRTPIISTKDDTDSANTSILIEDVRRGEKLKDIANTITNLSQTNCFYSNNNSTTQTTTTNNNNNNSNNNNNNNNNNNQQNELNEKATRDETDFHHNNHTQQQTIVNMRPKSLPLTSSTAPAIVAAIVKKLPPVITSTQQTTTSSVITKNGSTKNIENKINNNNNNNKPSPRLQQLKLQSMNQYNRSPLSKSNERGDPDGGCNLDDLSNNYLSKNSELHVNLPGEEVSNSKKGWLMKQDTRTGEWSKHWFTLRGAALFFYRDPVSEERGVLDGVLDVNSLTSVSEITTSRSFGFQLTTWDNRRVVLASISANSRNNWMNILKSAAGLQPKSNNVQEPKTVDNMETDLIINENNTNDLKTEIEKDFIKAQRNQDILVNKIVIHESSPIKEQPTTTPAIIIKPSPTTPVTPLTSKSILFSSDEEYRTASEGGRRESVDWGSPLSPSPPIPLALFRAKERMRNRAGGTSPRLHKRSRSSPPSSRRSTVDSIGSDELPLIHPVQEELNIDRELQQRLGAAEKERDLLREEAKEREARMSELLTTLERTELEMTARMREMEEARDKLSRQLEEANNNAEEVVNRLTLELEECQKKVSDLEDRLSRGIEENEILYKKLREMEGSSSSFSNLNRSKIKRLDSLSDLTNLTEIDPFCLDRDMLADEYTELRTRFEKAVNEIKAMKKELKESQNQYDSLELSYAALKQDLERRDIQDKSQLQMMAERIQDLTLKYTSSEKQVRTLKQKLAKSERRRSLSLKGKEQLTLSKELENKVNELETKVDDLEKSSSHEKITSNNSNNSSSAQQNTEADSKSSSKRSSSSAIQSRRRSLESSATSTDSLQFMVRLNDLEKRIESAASSTSNHKSDKSGVKNSPSNTKLSEHLVERLRCLEGVLVSSKDKLEQSLQQLQTFRSSRTRRSVSPITDRKDSFRFVERCLNEVVKLIRESCETCIVSNPIENCQSTTSGVLLLPDSSPIKLALSQLEMQLRNKLYDLLKQRRVLRERNELTSRKDLELLAERIAFESVIFGKLRDSIARAENPSLFGEQQTKAEVAETTQLMSILKAKLGGKCAFKPSGSLDILSGVLARRLVCSSYRKDRRIKSVELPQVDQKILDNLLRQQNEINLIAKRYKNNAMESLASGLAAETLSYISSNDAVQGAIQEAWRQAQETVNAELVQSEIAHVMLRNAERFENSVTPAFGYTLTSEERLTFENFADAVNDALRKEMDQTIEQLTQCYEESLKKMKRGQWRLHLEQDRKSSEGRQLLCEFADIIAHKALVDARISVLKGDYSPQFSSNSKDLCEFSIATLQKYENLFDELANDLQISNPGDMIAEADFNYIYKNRTIDFMSDETHIKEISTALGELEESLVVLESTLNPNTTISLISQDIENFKGVCFKCRELRQRVDSMMNTAQKLTEPCYECQKLQTNLRNLTNQHENELKNIIYQHETNITSLRKQIEGHLDQIKTLETERSTLIEELSLQSNIVEDHERELEAIQMKLKTKHDECHQKSNDNINLAERLQETGEKLKDLLNEREKLTNKCARQDEEYASLLQERDYIQAELNKERERSRKLEKRLEMLEREHSKQLECLQEAYRDQLLSHCSDISSIPEEESFRQRYQTEIEQLRTLCEKGLSAMESSHRRIIADLEERHRVEIERLLFEKEQALAEETQATLAALDAMRKAHQSEVQREVARFKQEFLRQFQHGENIGPIREKEEELEELREEILSFSEKYSIKCVENAALEEKLRAANQKLKHLQQMQQLELRNKQFRAHLASDDLSDPNFRHNLVGKGETTCPESEHDFDVKIYDNNNCTTKNTLVTVVTKEKNYVALPSTSSSPITTASTSIKNQLENIFDLTINQNDQNNNSNNNNNNKNNNNSNSSKICNNSNDLISSLPPTPPTCSPPLSESDNDDSLDFLPINDVDFNNENNLNQFKSFNEGLKTIHLCSDNKWENFSKMTAISIPPKPITTATTTKKTTSINCNNQSDILKNIQEQRQQPHNYHQNQLNHQFQNKFNDKIEEKENNKTFLSQINNNNNNNYSKFSQNNSKSTNSTILNQQQQQEQSLFDNHYKFNSDLFNSSIKININKSMEELPKINKTKFLNESIINNNNKLVNLHINESEENLLYNSNNNDNNNENDDIIISNEFNINTITSINNNNNINDNNNNNNNNNNDNDNKLTLNLTNLKDLLIFNTNSKNNNINNINNNNNSQFKSIDSCSSYASAISTTLPISSSSSTTNQSLSSLLFTSLTSNNNNNTSNHINNSTLSTSTSQLTNIFLEKTSNQHQKQKEKYIKIDDNIVVIEEVNSVINSKSGKNNSKNNNNINKNNLLSLINNKNTNVNNTNELNNNININAVQEICSTSPLIGREIEQNISTININSNNIIINDNLIYNQQSQHQQQQQQLQSQTSNVVSSPLLTSSSSSSSSINPNNMRQFELEI